MSLFDDMNSMFDTPFFRSAQTAPAMKTDIKEKDGLYLMTMDLPGFDKDNIKIELKDGYQFAEVAKNIKNDPYFANDETHVMQVENVDELLDMGHGVNLTRKGVSGKTQNQLFEFNMHINNPALTAQIMVSAARATFRQQPGCYTLIEIPVIDMLYGEREELIRHLV